MIDEKRIAELKVIINGGVDCIGGTTTYLSKQAKTDLLALLDAALACREEK